MKKTELIDLLQIYINRAVDEMNEFKNEVSELRKKERAQSFQEQIFKFLDFIYTNFPTDRSKLDEHFPRPYYEQSENKYKKRAFNFKKGDCKICVPSKMQDFLIKCYRINQKYNYPISLIDGIVKHELLNEISDGWIIEANGDIDEVSDLIKKSNEGDISIGKFIKIGSGSKNIAISNSNFGGRIIRSLKFNSIVEKSNSIILRNKKVVFIDWANNVIRVLQEILEEFKINKY